jgi:hypothetical protein
MEYKIVSKDELIRLLKDNDKLIILNEEEEKVKSAKNLLRTGDIVVLKDGEKCKVFLDYETQNYGKGSFAFIESCGFMSLSSYNDDLCGENMSDKYYVSKIYRPKADGDLMSTNLNDYKLIWEREKEVSIEEIEEKLKLLRKMSDYLTYEKEESSADIINYILEKKGEEKGE